MKKHVKLFILWQIFALSAVGARVIRAVTSIDLLYVPYAFLLLASLYFAYRSGVELARRPKGLTKNIRGVTR